ncbi:ClpP/crotonase-like domain-containing protein [Dichotomopilus funicola]|uniref:ClpP/crotonase-like domain-containing protein n=1 Tax=Dichotomopilus funicola TaxID=1934379 RepID=A0AAN6V961_9PEZI|nr:ClpP/crotonase-like domain-containing protein [Dichotomopilus funicola]
MAAPIKLEYQGRLAIITIDNEKKLGALDQSGYYAIARSLQEIATHDEVFITLLIGKGRYFSAGADVTAQRPTTTTDSSPDSHHFWLQNFAALNLNTARAFYTHPKILISALNGPVVGLTAALIAMSDFIYAAPHTFLLTPFSSLGLVAEGAASRALVQRLGVARANEALIMSRRITCGELVQAGFVNKVFDVGSSSTSAGPQEDKFRTAVLKEIDERLGEHLVGESLLGIKKLIRRPELDVMEAQNVAEVFAGLDRFVTGVPQEQFAAIASGKKRHKL